LGKGRVPGHLKGYQKGQVVKILKIPVSGNKKTAPIPLAVLPINDSGIACPPAENVIVEKVRAKKRQPYSCPFSLEQWNFIA